MYSMLPFVLDIKVKITDTLNTPKRELDEIKNLITVLT